MADIRFEYIPTLSIDSNPDRIRKTFKEDALDELKKTIEATGYANPITVKPETSGRYTIIFGERRWRACSAANMEKIPCLVVAGLTHEQQLTQMIVDNLSSLNCANTPQEIAAALKEFARIYHDNDIEKAAAALGRSRTWMIERLAILDVGEEIKEAAKKANMADYKTLVELDRLNKSEPERAQHLLAKMEQGERISRKDVVAIRGSKRKPKGADQTQVAAAESTSTEDTNASHAPWSADSDAASTFGDKPKSTLVQLPASNSTSELLAPKIAVTTATKEKLSKVKRALNLKEASDDEALSKAFDKLLELIEQQMAA